MEPLNVPSRKDDYQSPVSKVNSTDGPSTPSTPPHKEEKQENFFIEIVKFAVLALIIVIPFRMFIAQPFIVQGASMYPTFETGQYLIIDQVSYRFEKPQRGDVVVFRFPNDPSKYFIKRVVGLPGETVQVDTEQVTVKDPRTGDMHILSEPYLPEDIDSGDRPLTLTLEGDEYFVMGDNRPQSSDSRVWGPVPADNIVGKAFVRLLPPDSIGVYPGEYHYPSFSTTTSTSSDATN